MRFALMKPVLTKPAGSVAPSKRRTTWKRLATGFVIGVIAVLSLETGRVVLGNNFHEIMPGRAYRSAQLSPSSLRALIKKYGIRTVVNLRGCCMTTDWYDNECRVTHDLNVSQEDVTFSATRLPAPSEVRRLIDVFDRSEHPLVMHCRQGSDRTSLAATIYLLLYSDANLATARKQCSLRYAHLPILATACIDQFFDMYDAWLAKSGTVHAPEQFRAWIRDSYRPDPAPARLELLSMTPTASVGESLTLTVRATNLSHSVWQFKTGNHTGIQTWYIVTDHQRQNSSIFHSGNLDARVAAGESIDLSIPLPRFHEAGTYQVTIDLEDQNLLFVNLGSEWLTVDIKVVDKKGR